MASTKSSRSIIYTKLDLISFHFLLFVDVKTVNRFGDNWWKTPGLFFGKGGKDVSRPMCSKYPHLPLRVNKKISDHAFFQSRKIDIPLRYGIMGGRWIQFEYLESPPIWNTILECNCQKLDEDTSSTSPAASEENICLDGRIVNLSRGVGGDRSFFVYAMNSSNGNFHVVAHICIA